MKNQKIIFTGAFFAALIATPLFTSALQLLPACATDPGKLCQLNDLVQTFVTFSRLLLGFVGSAVLFFFVYGGFLWLTSGGSADRIKKGRDIVVNSVIGLVIVFAAFTIIQFVFQAVGARQETQIGQPCNDKSGARGVYVPADPSKPQGNLDCATQCSHRTLQAGGYACRDSSAGSNCIPGICTGPANIQCCQP